MSFTDEYYAIVEEQKKKKKEQKTGDAFTDAYNAVVAEHAYDPVATLPDKGSSFASIDIAPLGDMVSMFGPKITPTTKKDDDEDRKWFDTGAFDDGYQFGDVFKTILGTATDVAENIGAGILGMGEKALDAIAYVSPLLAKGQFYQNGGEYMSAQTQKMFNESNDAAKKWSADFIKKDLYDEEEIAKKIVLGTDKNSVLGEKSDALIQSGGQLLGTMGLQAVGVPWWVSYGVTTFGEESANAMNQGATYSEAGASAAISAAAEVLTEKLSGGITFGGKAVSDVVTSKIARGISNKYVRTLMALGVDAIGEGAEEWITADIQKFGQWLTYRDEEELKDLLFSEEAMDEKIEAFIGGAVLGGGVSTVNAVSSARKGVDYASKLTTDEKSVVDKVYQDRVAEAEKNGKITDKQKSRIYDQVRNDLENGYISVETIEEVLGDKDYQTYKETFDSEEAIRREYEELGKKQNATLAEQSRYTELEWKMRYLDKYSTTDALKNRLSEAVQQKVQGSRLVESYNERSRRGQAYEADISKYDEKQRETIQKAIDSGILNNTNRTHEFVDMIAKITADKGVLFDFTNNEKLKESGFAVDGKEVNGFLKGDTITLNMDSAKARNSVVGHEITHVLEGTELYQTLQDTVIEYAKAKGDYQGRYDALTKLYEGVEGADINAELTADLVGDYLFTDTDFVRNLSVQHRNVFQKIYDEIKYLCKVATAGSKEARELEKVKKAFEDAYRSSGNTGSGVKYSLENGKDGDYNKRSRYSETETVFLRWENGSAPIGEVKRFVRYGKVHYYEKTENGCVELSKSQYNERSGLDGENIDRRAEREIGKTDDYDVSSQRGTLGNPDSHRDTAGNASVFGQTVREELQHDTGRGTSSHAGYDNRNNLNLSEEAPDNSDASFFDTFSNDYATVRNYMKDGDTTEDDKHPKFSLSEPVESYAEIEKKRQELYQREMHLEERRREASKNPELLRAMDEATSLFSELRTLLPKRRNGTATQEELDRIEEIKVARDENIRRVAEIQEALGLGAMEAEAREIRETKEALRAASDAAWEREGAERENKAIEKADLTAPEYFRKKALKAFKTTTNFNEAGYLLPDGKMLNFSGGERNHRYRDHREIGEIYEATNGVKALNRFLSDGNIRVMAESPGVDIASGVEPTFEQYSAIRRFVKSHGTQDGRFFVDFSGVDGRRVGNYAYEGRVNADRVLNDIKHYFATGEIREQSSIGKFLSLSNVGEEANADSLSALKLEAAPVQETVAENATVEENLFPDDDYAPIADDPARFDSLDDRDMPPEREAPYSEEQTEYVDDPFEGRDFYEVGKRNVKAYMYENPEVKPFFQEEALMLGSELADTIKAERWYNDELYSQTGGQKGFGGNKRLTSDSIATLLDDWGMSYADIEKGINAIVEDHGAENIAAAKKIEFMLNDRLMNGYKNFYEHGYVEPNAAYLDLLYEKQINEYSKEAFDAFMANADQYAPPVVEDIAPVAKPKQSVAMNAPVAAKYEAIRPKKQTEPRMAKATPAEMAAYHGQQTMKGFEPKTAKVLTDEPKVDPKKPKAWTLFKDNLVDKGTVFETMSLKTGNRELQGKWKAIGRAESSAQWFMEHGNAEASSLKSIRETVEKSGKTKKFTEYLYHMHNVDRMSLVERNLDIEDKPVFGYGVSSDMSRAEAAKLEKANPEFKRWAKDVYSYNQAQREMMVENGLISRETADLWEQKYPHYVPVRRVGDEGLNINVALDTKKTGVNAPIKKATGGNRDILPLFDTMALRTEQTFKAIAKNRFGVELKNMLGTTIDTGTVSVDEMIDSVDMQDGLLQEGKGGNNPTFTVFENGERVTFEITEEMYDTMKPKGKFASYTNKVLNKANDIRRGLLTEYNPAFMLTNPIKDTQDVMINSQHPARTYANYPKAIAELWWDKGQYYHEYMEHGGEMNTYFDGETKTFAKKKSGLSKVIGFPFEKISQINNFIERIPRMAEYIASRKMGRSIDVSMLDAARVTTDFSAGGDFVKTLNRNGFTFLNASVQGAAQQVRNVREAKVEGLKGWVKLATKIAVAGLPSILLNHRMWDDDEEYAELSDYVKQNYYVVAKYGDGKFVRIPKGRALAVIQNGFKQMENLITGNDEIDFDVFAELVISNLAPSNPLENNLIAPIIQAKNNTTWYGDDLVPSRLQDLPAAEQYDETTDSLSKWLGEKLNISPYKINYLLDQYSGGVGDVFLPMLTPEAERGNDSKWANLIAPISDKFTTDSVLKNQNVTDFYSKRDELEVVSNGRNATKEDMLKKVFVDAVSWEMSDLYAQKREIQNSDMPDAEKYEAVREIQKKINALAESGLNGYEAVYSDGAYAEVGDRRFNYYKDKDTWYEIKEKNADGSDNWYYTQEQLFRDKLGVSYADYWNDKFDPAKNHVKTHYGEMNGKRYNYSEENNMWYEIKQKNDDGTDNWYYQKEQEVTKGLGISYTKYWNNREEYNFAYDHPQTYALAKAVGGYKTYMPYYDALENWQSDTYIASDKDENGDTIYNSRKKKVQAYLNDLDIPEMDKLLLYKSVYNSYDDRNYEIIDYLNKSDLTFEETVNALRGLGFDVTDDGAISWK